MKDNIKAVRELTGMSQAAFGSLFNATKDMVFSYEAGRAEPSQDVIDLSADLLGITSQQFVKQRIKVDDYDKRYIRKRAEVMLGQIRQSPGTNEESRTPAATLPERAMVTLTEGNKLLSEANKTLADANKVLGDANKTLSDAHMILTRGHQDLIDIMKILVQKGISLPEQQPAPPKPDPSTHKVSAGFEKLSGKTRKAGSQEGK